MRFLVHEKAPVSLMENPLTWQAMVVLAMPVAAKNMESELSELPIVKTNLSKLIQTFCSTFRENSIRIRN